MCKIVQEAKKAFALFDNDNSGTVTIEDLRRCCKELSEQMTDVELTQMLHEADLDENGEIDPINFFKLMRRAGVF
eukprot:gene29174-32395_t